MRGNIFDYPLEHEQHLRPPRDVRVDRYRESGVVHLAIDPIELVAPDFFDLPWTDEAMAVWSGLDEHHGRKVVEIPATGDLDQTGLLAALQRLHPMRGRLRIIDLGPLIAGADVIRNKIIMHQAMIVFDTLLDQKIDGNRTQLPPR